MKPQTAPSARPALIDALDRALGPTGSCALDPTVPAAVWRRALAGPAAEFLQRPGKELRAMIVRTGWILGGGDPSAQPENLSLVIELLHAGSLIVDDIEDDAIDRRGSPALHRMIGIPLAINTGTWMYFWALAELTELSLPAEAALAAHQLAIGTLVRCHQGQALDLATKIAELEHTDVPAVVAATTRLKTGTLCAFAAELGALAAGASREQRTAIARFGEAVGCALQMLDDLGSLTSPARRAKGREDLRGGRPTWPWAWLAEQGPFAWSRLASRERAACSDTQVTELDALADELAGLIGETGRARVTDAIDAALLQLVTSLGDSPIVDAIAADLRRMEKSYG